MWLGYIKLDKKRKMSIIQTRSHTNIDRCLTIMEKKKLTNQSKPTTWKADGILGTIKKINFKIRVIYELLNLCTELHSISFSSRGAWNDYL